MLYIYLCIYIVFSCLTTTSVKLFQTAGREKKDLNIFVCEHCWGENINANLCWSFFFPQTFNFFTSFLLLYFLLFFLTYLLLYFSTALLLQMISNFILTYIYSAIATGISLAAIPNGLLISPLDPQEAQLSLVLAITHTHQHSLSSVHSLLGKHQMY